MRAGRRGTRGTGIGLAAALAAMAPGTASAHVKWFCNFDVGAQPVPLHLVLTPDFLALSMLTVAVLTLGFMLDLTKAGLAVSKSMDRITNRIHMNGDLVIRATAAFFFVSLWTLGGIIMTPELKTDSVLIPQLQLLMAASLMHRRTTAFAGFGIAFLFAVGVANYGVFHLMDYPIFLGLAYYMVSLSFPQLRNLRVRPLDVVRSAAAVTLMWASIEKWAYPSWTMPLYITHPSMTFGTSFELFMCAAGVIEFGLAFALIWGPLVRRTAALILIGLFVSAIFEFGKVDAIGHSMIIAILLLVASDTSKTSNRRITLGWLATPAWTYAAALVLFMGVYYGLHAEMFHTVIF